MGSRPGSAPGGTLTRRRWTKSPVYGARWRAVVPGATGLDMEGSNRGAGRGLLATLNRGIAKFNWQQELHWAVCPRRLINSGASIRVSSPEPDAMSFQGDASEHVVGMARSKTEPTSFGEARRRAPLRRMENVD